MNNALAFKLVMSLCREGRVIKGYRECWPAQFYFQCKRKENSLMIDSLYSCHDFKSVPSVNCSLFSGQQTLIFLLAWWSTEHPNWHKYCILRSRRDFRLSQRRCWRSIFSGMWRRVLWYVGPKFSKGYRLIDIRWHRLL